MNGLPVVRQHAPCWEDVQIITDWLGANDWRWTLERRVIFDAKHHALFSKGPLMVTGEGEDAPAAAVDAFHNLHRVLSGHLPT